MGAGEEPDPGKEADMITLTKQAESLDNARLKVRERINALEDRGAAVLHAARERDNYSHVKVQLTPAEEKRIEKIRIQLRELEEEENAIANALGCIDAYA